MSAIHSSAGYRSELAQQLAASRGEWTFDLLARYDAELAQLAAHFGLDTYANQIEVIRADQMLDAYASHGMPILYRHWSFGKHFISHDERYRRGQMGLAYEIVINSDPCIAYLMEENTLAMQVLVLAHACYGHNSFFKGNYLFRTWTDAGGIIDYLLFARQYIEECEERHGLGAVEEVLDACHALQNYGVDRYRRPKPISAQEEKDRQREREMFLERNRNDLWRTVPASPCSEKETERFPSEPQENLLYFIEKNAPLLEPWQREIVRIVRKIAQYFYPQRQTQVMNEGWACFWHYRLLHELYDRDLVDDGFMLEFLQHHTNVIRQPGFDEPGYGGINPYHLGYSMFTDLVRIAQSPTEEDKRWFPEYAGANWQEVLDEAMRNFKDESFIQQFLSPKLIRKLRLFVVHDDDERPTLDISAIHDDDGYREIRRRLAATYNASETEPNIQVWNVNLRGDRSLTLRHEEFHRMSLRNDVADVLRHVHTLWGFPVHVETVRQSAVVHRTSYPAEPAAAN